MDELVATPEPDPAVLKLLTGVYRYVSSSALGTFDRRKDPLTRAHVFSRMKSGSVLWGFELQGKPRKIKRLNQLIGTF